jgi:hypothetical protein
MCALPECNAVGYIADFVALAGMHGAEHEKYAGMSGLERRYMVSHYQGPGEPLKYEMHGDIDRFYVCVFEVKVSRSDFLNTFGGKDSGHAKARMKPVGTAHWVVAEKGVCKPEELPDFWGLLEPYGAGLTEKKAPKLNILSDEYIHSIAFDMLWQSMNYRTSYYDQVIEMCNSVHSIRKAITRGKSIEDIRQLTEAAAKLCHLKGM